MDIFMLSHPVEHSCSKIIKFISILFNEFFAFLLERLIYLDKNENTN